ncbi:hypothetical protein J2S03_003241 [Alicyclobacillus cycloheptanicus]|uniref:Uncharacterized protein n=1 Tax=Alicyclobacillus cycloheptanicus TaxID=1457 RepID=A0ABT9XM55_9BACL|nr:hypothetical protein [Alicyclobacillus cycloheptanicus]
MSDSMLDAVIIYGFSLLSSLTCILVGYILIKGSFRIDCC